MSQGYQQRSNVDQQIVNETNAALGQMTSDMREVNDILRMQNEHAQNQQAGLNQVETNLQKAGDELDAGVQEMESARNLRRGCCGCCGVPPCCQSCLGDQCCAKCTIQ